MSAAKLLQVLAYSTRIQHYALKLNRPTLCVHCMVLLYRKFTVLNRNMYLFCFDAM